MKERPILFSVPMVRAILDGSKTQTRRVVKPQSAILSDTMSRTLGVRPPNIENQPVIPCPYGQLGDQLWVKENFHLGEYVKGPNAQGAVIAYATNKQSCFRHMTDAEMDRCRLKPDPRPWAESRTIPSILMPRWASRLTLEITEVRVERLQDISPGDCRAEGHPTAWEVSADQRVHDDAARDWYMDLWDSINAEKGPGEHGYSWAGNPWVWAISFKRI
ncbi:MAG: hypothetical protein LLG20_22775 [Acidobacteriales bacterium]|nr:hypothetical protein [Terriglobales bacterium]